MAPGQVARLRGTLRGDGKRWRLAEGWFLCVSENNAVCVYTTDNHKTWARTPRDCSPAARPYWLTASLDDIPSEDEWPEEVCAAVAAWRLTHGV